IINHFDTDSLSYKRKVFSLFSLPVEIQTVVQTLRFLFLPYFSYTLFPFFTHINNHVQAHEKVAQSFAGLQGIPFLFDQEIQ
ncbi:hypothetical protein, partial [Parabacteroides goldsteinii]|uniref:hypothetical protein n=1 Tax=Parabacteroides goldsteinii TaxID=328812 RepID=UPI002491841B